MVGGEEYCIQNPYDRQCPVTGIISTDDTLEIPLDILCATHPTDERCRSTDDTLVPPTISGMVECPPEMSLEECQKIDDTVEVSMPSLIGMVECPPEMSLEECQKISDTLTP